MATGESPGVAGQHPASLTPLIGRRREIAIIHSMLSRPEVRLVTLTGPGGVGKTRLAEKIGADLRESSTSAVAFVSLAHVRDPTLVSTSIAHVFGVRETPGQTMDEALAARLRAQPMLLLIDNYEQVLPTAPLVANLLSTCPLLRILVTSRAPLHVTGEHEFPVPPLPLPNLRNDAFSDLTRNEAVALFVERARAANPGFAMTPAYAVAVAAICVRLDGLPLAIELIAARSNVMTPAALLARLDNRLALLSGGRQDTPERLRTMRGAIAWSYDLLNESEQALFARVAVFAGGFTLDAAESIVGNEQPVCAHLDLIGSLVDQSLLYRDDSGGEECRFFMLETIREFGLERLEATGEADAIRRRHVALYTDLAEEAEPEVWEQQELRLWFRRLEAEQDNVRAALAWSIEHDAAAALRLAAALGRFWTTHGQLSEGRMWLKQALHQNQGATSVRHAKALFWAGMLANVQGDAEQAGELAAASLAVGRACGDRKSIGDALYLAGRIAQGRGDHAGATNWLTDALAEFRSGGFKLRAAYALDHLGWIASRRGDYGLAEARCEEALALHRDVGDERGTAMPALILADIAHQREDLPRAAGLFADALTIFAAFGDSIGAAECLSGLASVMTDKRPEQATLLLGAADAQRERAGGALHRVTTGPKYAATEDRIRRLLDEETFATNRSTGKNMRLDDIMVEARSAMTLAASRTGLPLATSPAAHRALTLREFELLRLVAAGRADKEIASALAISPRTVGRHVASILTKLGASSRAGAVAEAHRRHLLQN